MQLVKHEYGTITPQRAEEFKGMIHPEYQRPLTEAHVVHLARLIDDGLFLTGYVVLAEISGDLFCANGQHTLNAIIKSNKSVRCLIEWYKVDSMAEYVKLFHAFDTENRKRTNNESAAAFLMGRKDALPEVSPTLLNHFRMGADFAVRLTTKRKFKVTQYERFDAVVELREEFDTYLWLDKQKASRELLNRAPVIAAIVNTYAANPAKCREFWRQVVTGFFSDQSPDNPCVKLNRFLMNNSVTSGGDGPTLKGSALSRKEMYVACIHAWNAYVNERPIKQIRTSSIKSLPQVAVA